MSQTITAQDDQLHPPGDNSSPLYRESFFWGFYEPGGIWGMGNIAFHHHAPRTDRFLVLALPDGRRLVYAQMDGSPISEASLTAGAVRFIRVEPLVCWRIQAEAAFLVISRGQDISRILGAIRASPVASLSLVPEEPLETLPVRWDLTYTTVTGPQRPDWSFFSPVVQHYQAAGRVQGTIQIADQMYPFAGYGPHDHSWGLRDWLLPRYWYFGSFQVGTTSVHVVRSQTTDGRSIESGFIYRDGAAEALQAVHIHADHDPDNAHVRRAQIAFTIAGGDTLTLHAAMRDYYHFTVHAQGHQRCHDTETLVTVECASGQGQGILQYGHLLEEM